jgi:hypothetical protein
MARSIRTISVTWDPDAESREAAWTRIKTHVQEALDRIGAEHVLARRIARRLHQPQYARNQGLVQATRQGTPVAELARQYGISRQRVREIVRSEESWLARTGLDRLSGEVRHPARHGMPADRDVATAVPRTMMVVSDP